MAYDGKLLARARERLEQQRENNRAEHQRRLDRVYALVPEIREIDAARRGHMTKLVSLTLSRRPDAAEQIEALKEENLALRARRAELLVGHGWRDDYLDEIYSCPRCHDSGLLEGGQICSCVERLYNEELTKELSGLLRHGDESFEHFDLRFYSEEVDPARHISPRKAMEMNLAICRRFAESFPKVPANLLMQGGTGLGKTYLSACIARIVAGKGFSVCYDSAAAALDAFERQKFSRDAAEAAAADTRVKRMLSCDLMILDDLGTEMITSVSVSALYTLLNTRLVAGRRIILNTNLSTEDLEKKYGPQICSRLAGEFQTLPFLGQDIRRLKNA